jgi:hypothetical protein
MHLQRFIVLALAYVDSADVAVAGGDVGMLIAVHFQLYLQRLDVLHELAWTNRIHVQDGAAAALHVAKLSAPSPLYCVTDHEPVAQHDALMQLRASMGLPTCEVQWARDPLPETNKRISNRRLLASGFCFTFPTFREGYAGVIASAS